MLIRFVLALAATVGLLLLVIFWESPDYDKCHYGPGILYECE